MMPRPTFRRLPFLLLLIGCCCVAASTTAAAPASATSALPVIHNPEHETGTVVKATGELLRLREASPGGKLPAGSTAARLAEPGVCFKWTPSSKDTSPLAEADLMDAVLSPDESTLLLVERIGGSDAPNSSRFLFIAVATGGIVRAIEFPNRRISEVRWPAADLLFARQEAQSEFESPAAFLRISLPDGTISATSQLPPGAPPSSWCVGGDFLWFGNPGEKSFSRLPAASLAGTPEKIPCGVLAPRPLWLPAQRQLALYGAGTVEFYRLKRGVPEIVGETKLPAGFAPEQAVALNGPEEIALLQPGKPALALAGGAVRKIGSRTGKLLCFLREVSLLIVEEQLHNSLLPCKMPLGDPDAAFAPGKIKPLNRNANFRLLPLSGTGASALLIDAKANVWRLDLGGKRPKKSTVFEAVPSVRGRR